MQKLLTLDPTMIQSGLFSGVGKAAVPLWQDGNNIIFRDLGARRIKGGTHVLGTHTSPSTIRTLLEVFSAGKQRVYIGHDTGVQLLERTAGIWAASTLYTWPTANDYVQLEPWGNWLTATNDVNVPVVWKNAGLAAPIVGVPFTRARLLKRLHEHLLAFNTSNGSDMVEWSSVSNIESWTPGINQAGNRTIRDLESEIIAAETLSDRIGVYSAAGMALGTRVGGDNVWGFKRVLTGIGAVSAKSIVGQGPFHYGLMQNGIFKTDGNSFTFVDDPMMQRWLIDNVNWDQSRYIWGFHDDIQRAIIWNFLNVDLQWRSVSYHYDSGLMSKGNLQMTAGAPRAALALPVVADTTRKVNLWQQGLTFAGTAVPFNLRSKPLDFGVRDRKKILQMIKVDGQWDASVRLRVGQLATPEGTPDWFHDAPMTTENYFPEEREETYFTFELYGSADAYVTGMEFYGTPGAINL